MTLASAFQLLVLCLLSGALLFAAQTDARRLVIPNTVSLTVVALFPLWALASSPTGGIALYVLAAVATGASVLAVGFGLFALGLLGGGDVKLFAALAVWAGPDGILALVVVTVLAGGALAAFCLAGIAWRRLRFGIPAGSPWRQPLPYGCAVAVGGIDLILRHLAA